MIRAEEVPKEVPKDRAKRSAEEVPKKVSQNEKCRRSAEASCCSLPGSAEEVPKFFGTSSALLLARSFGTSFFTSSARITAHLLHT